MALRSRRYHKRSRNGCLSCIQRHVRCDEAKPCCGYCLTRGYDCEYRPETVKSKAKPASDSAAATLQASQGELVQWMQSPRISNTILGQMHVFNSLPVNLENHSIQLLHHFSTYTMHRRQLWPIKNNSTHQKWCNFAISDPALLHASLTLAAGNWIYLNGEMTPEYYHHKAEAMRMINQNLADPTTATSDGTVGAIVHLIMAESIYGSADIAAIHLRGLHRLLSIRGDIHSDRISFVLIRLIQMAYLYAECASQSIRFSHTTEAKILPKKPMENSLNISIPPKITFNSNVDIAILEIDKLDQGMLDCLEVLRQVSKVSSNTDPNLARSDKEYIETIDFVEKNLKAEVHRLETRHPPPAPGRIIEWHVANNLYWPLSLLLYFYLFIKRIPVGNTIYDDLVRKLKISLEESKSPHFQRIWPPALVLWMLVIGCVASWDLEEGRWFRKQLVVCRRGIGVTSWEGAEEILGGITWVEGIGGIGARRLWDELDWEVV